MSKGLRVGILPFSISGSGVAIGSQDMFPSGILYGRIRRVVVRMDPGGLVTACKLYMVHRKHAGTTPATIPDEYVVVETASLSPTASASVAFLDSPITAEPGFQDTLKLFIDATAVSGAGTWTMVGFIEVER